jgi:lipopolysaccharide heptosyltransferase I
VSERFLIVRLGSLGDVIHGIPVAAALRQRFPDASIEWVVDDRYVELLALVRGLDRTIAVDTRALSRLGATVADLRRRDYACAFDLQGLLKSAVLARLAGAGRTVGFTRAHLRERAAALFYSETVEPHGAHVIEKNLSLLTVVGIDRPAVSFPLDVPRTTASDEVDTRFPAGYVVINPGAAWPNKRWPPERFGAIALALERIGFPSIVLWGPGEEPLATAVVHASRGAAQLSPATTIADVFAIACGARLMVSGDTGPLHVAAAVGTPVVGLFGPTSTERNGPWSPDDVSISRMHTCACIYERRCRRPVPCIDDISVAEVVRAIEQRVSAPSPSGRKR